MSGTAFLQLRDALQAALLAAPALAGGRVYAGRTRPIAQEEASAINLRLSDTQATHPVLQATDWRTVVIVECAARAAPGGPAADTAADALLADAHTRLHDFAAPGLGLLQVTDDATVEWDHDADDTAYTCATLRLTVVHRTPAATLQPWS
jgi:hypothetical protein